MQHRNEWTDYLSNDSEPVIQGDHESNASLDGSEPYFQPDREAGDGEDRQEALRLEWAACGNCHACEDEGAEPGWREAVGSLGVRDVYEVVQACMEEIVLESAVLQFLMERMDYPLEGLVRGAGFGYAALPPLQ